MEKERRFGPDAARCGAAVSVLCVHFFLNNGFYAEPLAGGGMTLSVIARTAFMVCVPLFMVLTGYLEVGKNWGKGHLRKLLPVLVVYLLCGLACLTLKAFYLHQELSPAEWVKQLLAFSAAPYAWYVEMYIGLFLLAPIFDLAWRAMDDRQKKWTVWALLFLTCLPSLVNVKWMILPDYWLEFYPVCYYFIGRYLKEHPVKVNGWGLFLGWVGTAAAGGLLHVWLAKGGPFSHTALTYYNSPLVVLETVCVFSLLVRTTGERCPKVGRGLIRRIARLSLPIYLISYIYDALFYPILNGAVPQVGRRLWLLPVMALGSLLCSGILAQVVEWAANAILTLLPRKGEEVQ